MTFLSNWSAGAGVRWGPPSMRARTQLYECFQGSYNSSYTISPSGKVDPARAAPPPK